MNETKIKEAIVKLANSTDYKIRVYLDESKFFKTGEIEIFFEFLEDATEVDDCRWFDNAGNWCTILREELSKNVDVRLIEGATSTNEDKRNNLTIIFE